MGMKIKKFDKSQSQRLKPIKVQYILAVPLLGIVDVFTMMSFFFNPSTDGMVGAKVFFVISALIGAGFAIWSWFWNVISDNKRIVVNPIIGRVKEVPYDKIKKIEVHKKKKRDQMVYYSIIGMDDNVIVKIYPMMKNSGDLFNRLSQMNIRTEELKDA